MKSKIAIGVLSLLLVSSSYFNYRAYPAMYDFNGVRVMGRLPNGLQVIAFSPKLGVFNNLKAYYKRDISQAYATIKLNDEYLVKVQEHNKKAKDGKKK